MRMLIRFYLNKEYDMNRFLITACLLLGLASTLWAQTTGRLIGIVSGPDGVLPNATVTAKDTKTGKVQTVVSSDDGAFIFPQLDFGTYTVTVTASGFKTYVANEVKIDVGRDYSMAPALHI